MSDMMSISTRRRARGESQKSIAPYQSARKSRRQTMRDKAMPLGKKFKVRLTITPEETGTPVDMLGFTFTSGKNGHTTLNAQYSNIPKLVDDGLDSLSILVILKTLETWAQKGYELCQPIVQRFYGGRR